ncbi:MAG: polymer-forming cytoskeletal protein [Leptospiraceae bacterium]|nr:polymer-forming cytoskeletal protein [Leptospiraceae bacterium]MDW8307295.1 polymer-forming cytoskeletal protein [Leptospiraceae bacterium]
MTAKENRKKIAEATVFQATSTFRGILHYSRPLRILGKFQGEIFGKDLLEIGQSARVEANIETTHLIVYGHITGNVHATEKVELKKGATLIGNIKAPQLEIEDGVVFEGMCEMKV